LSEAQGRIKVLEKNLENQHKQNKVEQRQQQQQADEMSSRKDDHILSMTISTLQNLILEKDTTLSRYQELLKSERQHNMRTFDSLSDEIKQLKKVIDGHENVIAEKERIVEKLKRSIEELKEER
jgi:centrosomal protein CEP290